MEPKVFNSTLKKVLSGIVNVDKLIELVKARPVIWDKTAEGYRNRDVVGPAWNEVYRNIFENYDLMSVEQKKCIGKYIKGKWTNARDCWRRKTNGTGKQNEAGEMVENVKEFKDDARYEQLKFLDKVYKKTDLQFDDVVKHFGQNVGNNKRSLSPKIDLDGDTVPYCNINFKQGLLNSAMNSQEHLASKKRKLENTNMANTQAKGNQGNSSQNPFMINVGHMLKANTTTGLPASNSKPQTSFTNGMEINKNTSNQIQSSKCEKINPVAVKQEIPSPSQKQPIKNNPGQSPQKLVAKSLNLLVTGKQENPQRISISNDSNTKPEVIKKIEPNHEPDEIKEERSSTMRSNQDDDSANTELQNFFQVILKPRIEAFNQAQMMNFFFEMFKPHIKDLNKHQLLDFQIEALQLVKKFEMNEAT